MAQLLESGSLEALVRFLECGNEQASGVRRCSQRGGKEFAGDRTLGPDVLSHEDDASATLTKFLENPMVRD